MNATPDSAALCAALVNGSPDALFFCDPAGVCRMANPRCAEVFGVDPGRLVGKPVGAFFPAEAGCSLLRQHAAVLGDGVERGCELSFGKGGSYWVCHTAFRDASGATAGIVCRMRNLGAEKRLEKVAVEAADRVMERIARDLHDDLCQDLAAASLIARLLQHRLSDQDKTQAKVAAHIADLTRQMAAKTRDVVHGLAPGVLDGDSFVASLREVAGRLCEAYPVQFGIEGRWPDGFCRQNTVLQLYRIAHEAMHNAARHSKGDNIVVRLQCAEGFFILSISDNGCGIASGEGGEDGSCGLGLAIMRHRAGLVGGELTIRSTPQEGTCVSCKVPL